ncbi:MAG TPA: DUF5908 family protein [Brumimicrobium sp.]|nr:DUF5908 family protein [Brumimicrobium sp.]
MPVEIKELLIEINVANSKDAYKTASSAQSTKKNKNEILTECIEQVMTMIENKNER